MHVPIVMPGTWEAEARKSLEPMSLRHRQCGEIYLKKKKKKPLEAPACSKHKVKVQSFTSNSHQFCQS
jgi:hypothetical protein